MNRNWSIQELKGYLHNMEESAMQFYKVKKGIIERPKPKFRLDFDGIKEDKEQKKKDERRKRDELKPALIQQNELYYFGPAKVAIDLTREGLNAYKAGDVNDAIAKLEQAVENFSGNPDLSFNLGKMYLESGMDVAGGLLHLIEYLLSNTNEYYSKELSKILHLTRSKKLWKGYIDNEEYEIHFEIDDDMVHFDEIPKDFTFQFYLPYKVPVSLDLERKDKEKIEMVDYQFLKEIFTIDESLQTNLFEITINKGSFTPFVKEFYGTLLELSYDDEVPELTSFKDLHIEQLEQEHYYEGQFNEPKEVAFDNLNNQLVSVSLVEIHKENRDEFLDLFTGFAKKYLINEKSDEELDQEEDEWEYRQQEEYDSLGRFEMESFLYEEYQSFVGNSQLYGDVSVILYNLENNVPDPYETKNELVFKEKQEMYMAIWGDVFDAVKPQGIANGAITFGGEKKNEVQVVKKLDDSSEEKLHEILGQVRSEKVKKLLTAHFNDIFDTLEDKAHLSMVPMRLTLEVILQESSLKIGINLLNGDRRKTLHHLIEETKKKRRYPKKINDQMYNIRTMANSSLHYDALEEYISINEVEVKELLSQLLNIVEYFVKRFGL
ncbi:tetratricopeptide repeat protein [Metabacillus bambusae]|uniref:Tetratricopeptide repeat protein n=1 Tax=Metabacillus bambusae TaxID=2795218 RepID=A0ABS3N0U3_9BACI|nr:tetratricopeptide repeat protein [Metabacillus bambusae]MBO1511877.1 tetratricopeptide repeat protein [Metabacillus bambusae]